MTIFAHLQSISRKPQSNGTRESGVFGGSSHHRQVSYGSTIYLDEVLDDEFFRQAVDDDASVDLSNLDYRRNDNGRKVQNDLACVGKSSTSGGSGMNGVQREGTLCMIMQRVQSSESDRSTNQGCAPWKSMCGWAVGITSKFLVCLFHPTCLPPV
jgi:hypothetical protein